MFISSYVLALHLLKLEEFLKSEDAMEVNMQGKRPVYLLLTALVLLNLVATNLQAEQAQSAFQANLQQGWSVAFQFASSR